MANIIKSLYNIRMLDELAEKRTVIHSIHPLMKVMTTLAYLITTVSYDKYAVSSLLPLVFYPVVIIVLAEIPPVPIVKMALAATPFLIGIGILNPLFHHEPAIILSGIQISEGWISFLSIMIKGIFNILAALILIATTGMTGIASALRMLRIPRVFVLQLLLTYRYISVLAEEAVRIWEAYMLRTPGRKAIAFKTWVPCVGRMLMGAYGRARRVYQAMALRGFHGEYNPGDVKGMNTVDFAYCIGWVTFFVLVRYLNFSAQIGAAILGVMK
ncbi:energy-coupling factor transporter transmembrane component T family protein [Thermotalea metallivorans]|nr:energy-coupling factor transporter transmembrane component T [Thermotalea metallivorans]